MAVDLGNQLAQLGFIPELAGLMQQSAVLNSRPFYGPTIAFVGTSITDQCTRYIPNDQPTPSSAFFADGYITHFMQLSGQRCNFPLKNSFGVSGNTFVDIAQRLQPIIKVNAAIIGLEGGSNDFTNSDPNISSLASVKANWLVCAQRLRQTGALIVIIPAPPRAGAVLTAAQLKVQMAFTTFQREFCHANPGFLFCDYLGYWLDQTSATSVPLAGMVKSDNLHPTTIGAYWMGKALADLLNPYLPQRPTNLVANADIYDATNNPTGSLLYTGASNRSLVSGTGGTETANANLTYTGGGTGGGLAAGWTFLRGTSTSVCTVTNTKQNPTTAAGRASGERQIIQIAASSGGGADEVYNFRFTPALADVAAGDWYYGEVLVEITAAPVNMNALELYVLETRPSNSQTSIDGSFSTSLAGVWPQVTDLRVLRSPPIQRTSDASALQWNLRARFKTDVSTAGITAIVGDPVMRKVEKSLV